MAKALATGEARAPIIVLSLDKPRSIDPLIVVKRQVGYPDHAALSIAANNIGALLAGDARAIIVAGFDLREPIIVDDMLYMPHSKHATVSQADIVTSVTATEITYDQIGVGQGQQLELRF